MFVIFFSLWQTEAPSIQNFGFPKQEKPLSSLREYFRMPRVLKISKLSATYEDFLFP
jgi:hypothetical protein